MSEAPSTTVDSATGASPWERVKRVWSRVLDPRYTRLQRWSFVISLALVFFAVTRIPGNNWADRIRHGWYHVFVVTWFCLLSYKWRTVGTREIIRFWVTGFFPVALITYILAEPVERMVGTGNIQTAVWVPIVEEIVKVLPLFVWTTVARPKHRHGTMSDFWILGFAIGAGFSFHEDALYNRLVASGFSDGITGKLFPIFLTGGQYVITHAGWTALAAVGVGAFSLYRKRAWGWVVGVVLLAIPIIDHAAVNWRGGGAEFMRSVAANGHLGSILLLLTAFAVVAHDWYVLKWATDRDRLFPRPRVRTDLVVLRSGSMEDRLSAVLARQRYRRFRNAAFCDLYRVRSLGQSAGDRGEIRSELSRLARPIDLTAGFDAAAISSRQ